MRRQYCEWLRGDIVIIVLRRIPIIVAAALAFAAWPAVPVLAQDNAPPAYQPDANQPDAGQPDNDPPTRAARLSYIEGSASLQPAGVDDWNAAPLNQPLTVGDALWIDRGSHAELDLGSAVVRLDQSSSVTVLDFSDQALQLRLNAGTMDITVSGLDAGASFEIDAPNAAVALLRPGEYRLGIDNAGNTSVAIRNGQARVISDDQQSMNLLTGQRALYGAHGSYALAQAAPPDDFDHWCQQREARWADEQAVTRYVSSDVVGYEDLNDYGQWQQEPDVGNVWFPTQVGDDWVPYSAGHWAWVVPWGWSWVDDAPWGFAPFHYGRWIHTGRRWGWVPAPARRHAVYAPALVAWIGGPGTGMALSLGGGAAVGWLPLAPGEVYVPGYGVSPRYLQNVNISNTSSLSATTVINVGRNPALQDRYANQGVPHALTVVPQINFTAGQPVGRHLMPPPPQFLSAKPTARVPGIVPGRESVLGAVSLGRVGRPPPAVVDRPVVTHRQPPPPLPGFELQQPAILANGGHPLNAAQLAHLRVPQPSGRLTPRAPTAPGAPTAYRGIPERAPQFQPPAQALGPNVFRQRDQELEQQREAQMREQQAQELQQQQQLRLQEQQLKLQHKQLQPQQQRQLPEQRQEAPPRAAQPQHPKPEIKRPAEPLPPSEQR